MLDCPQSPEQLQTCERMPTQQSVARRKAYDEWLAPDNQAREDLPRLLKPSPSEERDAFLITT